jgi:hypothetical protein
LIGVATLWAVGVLATIGCDDPAGAVVSGSGGAAGPGATGGLGGAVGTGGAGGSLGSGGSGVTGGCTGTALGVAVHASAGANHTQANCDPVAYTTVPPSSGTHYPTWPAYKTYLTPVPWGFLVHGLEHGAVVIVYNCPAGCAAEVAAAQAWIDGLPGETACGGARPRLVLAPDPTLDVRWAATSWTWTLRACSFDQAMFNQFFTDHYGAGLEVICSGGPDLSATGWCP